MTMVSETQDQMEHGLGIPVSSSTAPLDAVTPDSKLTDADQSHDESKLEKCDNSECRVHSAAKVVDQASGDMYKKRISSRTESFPVPDTVTVLSPGGDPFAGTLYLVGTAHFSTESQNDVRKVIHEAQPDAVMIELCESRMVILSMDEDAVLRNAKEMNYQKIRDTIKEFGILQGVMNVLLLNLSASLTKQLGMAPGGEFRVAVEEARSVPGCQVTLGDRLISITLKRVWGSLSLYQKVRLFFALCWSANQEIKPEEVEKAKNRDLLEELLTQLAGEFPALSRVLVTERDQYMACALKSLLQQTAEANRAAAQLAGVDAQDPVLVGVVGIGHVRGIAASMSETTDIRELIRLAS